jgi:CubicO group peptidase (beta-lactamase class C family)
LDWIQTIGYADLGSKQPVNKETVFNIGSLSKMVSAWGFMQLVENGLIGLDDPVNNYLKRWKVPESKFNESGVTPRRLMSHTAGVSQHSVPGFDAEYEPPTLEESLTGKRNGSEPVELVHEPGSKWQYSGGGYTIMQLLLEETTNINFATYMKKNVFEPLGMANTDYRWTEDIKKKAAKPYDKNGNPLRNRRFPALAAAGLQTNMEDLVRFAELSINKDAEKLKGVLKAETIDLMQKTVLPSSDEGESGLGYYKTSKYGLPLIGHGGSNAGWVAQLTLHLPTKSGLIIMCNSSNGLPVRQAISLAWADEVKKEELN